MVLTRLRDDLSGGLCIFPAVQLGVFFLQQLVRGKEVFDLSQPMLM
jgi:hypothetical protein